MHILVTADTVGGVWTYTRELTCGLLARGHRVSLVSFGEIPTHRPAPWLNHKNLTYHSTAFPLEWMENAQRGVEASVEYLAKIIHHDRPDILHLNQFCYGALDVGIPKIVVAHSDVLTWWNAVHDDGPPRSSWLDWYTEVVSRGLSAANAVVAPSQWMLDALRMFYKLPSASSVIYNGRTESLFRPSARKSESVLSVGRIWDEGKQIRLLLEREHKVPLRLAGAIHQPGKASTDGSALKLTSKVRFCGEQDEEQLRELYADSAAYAATSRYEPFGLAPVEAALSRCALVLNDIPVFHELWEDAAFYFERNNSDSLAEAIRLVSEFASLRDRLADSAFERARRRFGSTRMVIEYENLYCTLTGKSENA